MDLDAPPHRVLLRVVDVHQDKGGRYPAVVVVAWDGTDASLRQAHRLPRLQAGERALRRGEALGFTLIGSPSDPPSLKVIPVTTDRRTPRTQWYTGYVIKWTEIGEFLAPDGTAAPWPG